jgi:hypothetical protein
VLSYYRLRSVDNDGTSEVTKVVSVTQLSGKTVVKLFPQPTENQLNAQFETKIGGTAQVTVLDAAGRVIFTQKQATTEGVNNLQIPTADWAKGIYFLQIADGTTTLTEKFFKK